MIKEELKAQIVKELEEGKVGRAIRICSQNKVKPKQFRSILDEGTFVEYKGDLRITRCYGIVMSTKKLNPDR